MGRHDEPLERLQASNGLHPQHPAGSARHASAKAAGRFRLLTRNGRFGRKESDRFDSLTESNETESAPVAAVVYLRVIGPFEDSKTAGLVSMKRLTSHPGGSHVRAVPIHQPFEEGS